MTYGTGAIMAVPAHDERDFEFAKKYGLEIRPVVKPADDRKIKKGEVFTEEGIAVNSSLALSKNTKEKFSIDNLPTKKAKKAVIEYLEKNKLGKRKITYKLRDWLISRQRFWGAPIPVLYSKEKLIPLKEEDLPVVLPMDVEFKPTGESPLKDHKEFQKIDKKKYPEAVRREADTMDTFVDSSWYFLRFAQLNENFNSEENPFTDENIKKHMNSWMPVDLYMGGAEHTVLHLLYARFFTKVLFDLGYLNFDEPFLKLRHQGMILGPDHRKMSKRWGNIINPLDVCEEYGADTLRMYEMFMGPIDAMKPWNVKSVQGIYRFLGRVWKIYAKIESEKLEVKNDNVSKKLRSKLYKTVKKVTEDIPELKFNTAIAAMMEFVNEWEKNHSGISISDAKKFLQILAPFAPFITEEIWSSIFQEKTSIHLSTWPNYDDKLILDESVKLPIQVNGKVRSFIEVKQTSVDDQNSIVKQVLNDAKIKKYLDGQNYKVIYIKGKIINFVIKA
jgi:leucyl-tRNA synthetase